MTKKDYAAIAESIHRAAATMAARVGNDDLHAARLALETLLVATRAMADTFAASNPRFDRDRFMLACGFGNVSYARSA